MFINEKWDKILHDEFMSDYFEEIMKTVDNEYKTQTVFPPREKIFEAMRLVDYDDIKVVILGQDPYHNPGQANGLAFAVNNGVPIPPSLENIFREVQNDLGGEIIDDTSLLGWAEQGVLLLNTSLTVRCFSAMSHTFVGWQQFTDAIIRVINNREKPVAFILWGGAAQKKRALIDKRHFVVTSAHPSPLSAYRGFFGSRPFGKVNAWLRTQDELPVNWLRTSPSEPCTYYPENPIKPV